MSNKYKILKNDFVEIKDYDVVMGNARDIKLYRIKALKDFNNIEEGDLGGYIEKEENLSQEGNCWVHGDSMVFDNARISDNARIFRDAKVHGNARIYDSALVHESNVHGDAKVYDNAGIIACSDIYGNAEIHGYARVSDSTIRGNTEVYENASVYGSILSGDHKVKVHEECLIDDNTEVYGDTEICGYCTITGNAILSNDAIIESKSDYCTITGFGSAGRTTTFFKCKDGNIKVNCGCFNGTLDEFRSKVKERHKDSKYAKEYLTIADLVEKRLLPNQKEDK